MPATLEREEETLSPRDIVRAWEDKGFRSRLSPAQRERLPDHPVGAPRLAQPEGAPVSAYSQFGSCDACSTNNCSSNNCSSSNCSSDNCSSSNCSSDNCSSNNCTGNLCTNWRCGG